MSLTARAFLFDNDGTLVDSMASVVRCWTAWAQEFGISGEDFGRVQLHGRPAVEIVADLVPAQRVGEAVRRIEELELADVSGVVVLPGTLELLGALPAGRWAVVTSATRALAAKRLASVGIHPPLIVAADDVRRGKPDPEPFLLGAQRLGVDPADCVVFEDAPVGLAAARAAGMRSVALTTTHPQEDLIADHVIEGLHRVRVHGSDEMTLSFGA
ncbi:HAD family hydrolase [Streptomyces gamaensis]|uniref:HAD family hydrolase n=1 Tax=Streptomyces gamaensis TaxID=1763542 RepID=A0ABW0YY99_9ACTN